FARFESSVDIGNRKRLGLDAELAEHTSGKAADAELESLQIVDAGDLVAEPAAHLSAAIATKQGVNIVLGIEAVEQFETAAMQHPGRLHAAVEAEGHGRAEGEGRVDGEIIVARRLPHLDRACLERV